ncbi:mechanosensitive ion channel family protein, partial [Patescibacteria group bacterium]|nr:mechanosensitive ion channel family protein [Patescibacteria group bacterium]
MIYSSFWEQVIHWLSGTGIRVGIIILVAFVARYVFVNLFNNILQKWISARVTGRASIGHQKRAITLGRVMAKTADIIIFSLALLTVLLELGINVTPVLTGAGILGLAIGFGAQDMIKNIFHGLFILIEDQYSEGDIVSVGGKTGTVEAFDLRRTVLRDLSGTQHHIPNGEISTASNMTKGWSNLNWDFGVAYKTDFGKLREAINDASIKLKERYKEDVLEVPVLVGIEEFADSAITVKILGKVMPGKQWEIMRAYREILKIELDKAG